MAGQYWTAVSEGQPAGVLAKMLEWEKYGHSPGS